MGIVGGCDIHRTQVTFDWVDLDTGESRRGRIAPANRASFRDWLGQFQGRQVDLVVEGCTGWRFIAEECQAAGVTAHVADPAEAASRVRGNKRRPKTDRLDARGLRELLEQGRVPESWIPSVQVLEVRTKVRCYHDVMDDRSAWLQRIHATLFHQGAEQQQELLRGDRARLHASPALTPAGVATIEAALRIVDALDGEINRLRQDLVGFGKRQPGCLELPARVRDRQAPQCGDLV